MYPADALILPLSGIDAELVDLVGGKAANLGSLTAAGFPVPQGGFCLTTAAYRRVVDAAGPAAALAHLDSVEPGATAAIEAAAARVRSILGSAGVPVDIRHAIERAYNEIGGQAVVAVRSSATAEDLPTASFAGQQDSFLGIVGVERVLEAVRQCWVSLWSDRAVTYRRTQGLGHHRVAIAVIVQIMIDSAVAGVLFTANAVTGRRRETVIDASPGLGESVVSGAVTPDHVVVDTVTGRVIEQRIGTAAVSIRMRPGGGTEHVRATPSGSGCLDGGRIRALTAIGERVERHFGSPQDIEWAFDAAGELWLTQSRPITTLFPLPRSGHSGESLRVYFCFSVAQGLYRPLTPAGLSAFRVLASSAADIFGRPVVGDVLGGPPVYAEAGQRVFVDLTGVLRSRVGRRFMPRVLDLMESRSAGVLRDLFDRPEFAVNQRSVAPSLRRMARIGVRYRIPVYAAQALVSPAVAHRRLSTITTELRLRLTTAPGATPQELLDHVERTLYREAVPLAPRIVPGAAAGLAMFTLAARLLGADAAPGRPADGPAGSAAQPDHRDGPGTVARCRAHPHRSHGRRGDADDARRGADRTVSQPGTSVSRRRRPGWVPDPLRHRAIAEIDIGLPRWSEDPAHLLGVLANYLRVATPSRVPMPSSRAASSRPSRWWTGSPPWRAGGGGFGAQPSASPSAEPANSRESARYPRRTSFWFSPRRENASPESGPPCPRTGCWTRRTTSSC